MYIYNRENRVVKFQLFFLFSMGRLETIIETVFSEQVQKSTPKTPNSWRFPKPLTWTSLIGHCFRLIALRWWSGWVTEVNEQLKEQAAPFAALWAGAAAAGVASWGAGPANSLWPASVTERIVSIPVRKAQLLLGTGRPSCRRPSSTRERQEKQYTNIYGNSLWNYTEGGDKTSQYPYPVAILSNWVPDNWVYRLPILNRNQKPEPCWTVSISWPEFRPRNKKVFKPRTPLPPKFPAGTAIPPPVVTLCLDGF